jgi:predicted 3-demethylubiquinone-9 3-methyltransferase (glyoxalase superfamily)
MISEHKRKRRPQPVQKIVPSLWFDTQAEEAAKFYCSIFADSRIVKVTRYGSAGPRPEGLVMTVDFQLQSQDFNAINGGPDFKFTEATSLLVNCRDQQEVDQLWEKLGEDGEPGPCGWLKDKFGLSWQIVPAVLEKLLGDPDPVKSQRVMAAMLQMGKIDVAELRRAYEQEPVGSR